jgi:hypothetical protein
MNNFKHNPLPWRITSPEEKKGREIVDAKGGTVAKLTALDLPNAELIVASVNKDVEGVKYITHHSQLEVGREYWLVSKKHETNRISKCKSRDGCVFFEDHIWAHEKNNQAMERWNIFGPVPLSQEPDFEALMASNTRNKEVADCLFTQRANNVT